jgi:predicted RNase H-like HicB family nuclease
MKFPIAIEPGTRKTAFGVVVPDLPGCFSAGDTIEEAFENAVEAITLFCEVMAERDGALPDNKGMSHWQKNREYKDWTWGIVEVPVEKFFGPAEKINITVPARMLRKIDEWAKSHGQTRSGFLVEAAAQAMK